MRGEEGEKEKEDAGSERDGAGEKAFLCRGTRLRFEYLSPFTTLPKGK